MAGPLNGITIFDMTHAAVGPWATMLLAGLGANVIKVEIPGGDLILNVPPRQKELGVVYSHCNLNKRSITLNLKDEAERAIAYRILGSADVFIENMRPATAARLGFDYETVRGINPSIVYVNSSAWGSAGPMGTMGGNDGAIQAFSGFTTLNGAPGGPGEYMRHFGYVDLNTSQSLAMAVLEGLVRRERTGETQRLENTMLGACLFLQFNRLAEYLATGMLPETRGSACPVTVPHQAFLCQDKAYLAVGAVTDPQWRSLCEAVGADLLGADPRFATNPGRVEHRDELLPQLEEIFKTKPRRWWQIKLTQARVPYSRFMDFEQIRYRPQVQENELIVALDVPHQGKMHFANLPWRFNETPLEVTPPPYPGKHREEILAEYEGPAPDGTRPGTGQPEAIAGALDGLTVVDVTQGFCGPMTSMLLAELGAQVIKVEPPEGDYARGYGPPFLEGGESPSYFFLNRRKKVMNLDLESEPGRDRLRALLKTADFFLEDLGPGRAEGMGLGYEALHEANPALVYCAISALGELGPHADRPATELTIQAMADCWTSLGQLDEPPQRLGADVANVNTGMHAAQGMLAAWYYRRQTGRGQRVAVSMYGSVLNMRGLSWTAQTNPDEWFGYHVEHLTMPRDIGYKTKDLPVYFNLRRGDEEDYHTLLIELGMEAQITDHRFAQGGRLAVGSGRYAHQVKYLWEQAFAERTAQEVIDLINGHRGEAVPVNDYPALFAHPQLEAIGVMTEVEHPKAGRLKWFKLPWKVHDQPNGA